MGQRTPHKKEALDSEDLEQGEGPEKVGATREEYEFYKDWEEADGTGQESLCSTRKCLVGKIKSAPKCDSLVQSRAGLPVNLVLSSTTSLLPLLTT